jgi:glucan phosphoethanolaminetransferase (alkaline phosphatase superfamily)
MQIKPIKKRLMVKLSLIWTLVFFIGFAIIAYSVNPFEASVLILVLFYAVLFCLLLGILNLIRAIIKIPFKIVLIIDIIIIIILIIKSLI